MRKNRFFNNKKNNNNGSIMPANPFETILKAREFYFFND
jgi:hypothetical protein